MSQKSPGSKNTKIFGISLLKTTGILEDVINSTKSKMSEKRACGTAGVAAEADVDEFLKIFVETVQSTKSFFQKSACDPDLQENMSDEPNAEENEGNSEDSDNWDALVWSDNWQVELERRRHARSKAAKARVAQTEKDKKEYAEYLRSVVNEENASHANEKPLQPDN